MLKVKMTVSGRVQGVGFRYFVITTARQLGIFGRVWNNDDGTVGILAQTPDAQKLAQFTALVRGEKSAKGRLSPFAKVTSLESSPASFPDFTDFNIKY
ncbi:acylphosphatase [Lactococcus kimchii]|uniref:acylphosphatase n=1 Tax=Lactococcus sp. S-13 TaxID=2507158 RepID=UPI001022EC17|nr:acylphosphatase [Lactococcus sp. S-13]RZI48697.1 acylphosphatase [Lactococcus sp. S-13]